jgi:hypothetical protein
MLHFLLKNINWPHILIPIIPLWKIYEKLPDQGFRPKVFWNSSKLFIKALETEAKVDES